MKIKDIQYSTPYLYHVSQSLYTQPSLYEIDKRYNTYHHKNPNGVLGLWLSPCCNGYEMFGNYRYRVQLHPSAKIGILPFNELIKMNRNNNPQVKDFADCVAFYKQYRNQQSQHYDVLCVMSAANEVAELIVLNLDIIQSFELHTHMTHTNRKKSML